MLERSAEVDAGDHDDAAVTLVDLAIVWAVLLLVAVSGDLVAAWRERDR